MSPVENLERKLYTIYSDTSASRNPPLGSRPARRVEIQTRFQYLYGSDFSQIMYGSWSDPNDIDIGIKCLADEENDELLLRRSRKRKR